MQHTGGFLMDFECLFIKVHARYYGKFLPCCADYYGGKGFRALQMVIPSTEGFWPWEDAQVAKREPILGTCNVSMVKKNLRGVCR